MSNFVEVGEMNERIKFIKKINGKDALGGNISKPVQVYSCWASVRSQYLSDVRATIGTILEGTLTFIIRYCQDYTITNDLIVEWNNDKYEIISMNRDTVKKDYTTIVAKAVS